jgi:alpha-glucosidase (family GH31 glycosyl hydrolase)
MKNNKIVNGVSMRVMIFFGMALITIACTSPSIEKPPVTPYWALGHIVWEDSINTQEAAQNLVDLYVEHELPVSGIIIDSPWSLSYNDFNWDKARYPEPEDMISGFREQNIKVMLWLTGCVNLTARGVPVEKSPDYDYVVEQGYAVNNGKPSEWWKGDGVHIDFTNPDATEWWDGKLDKVFGDGVAGWKVDQGEYYFGDSLSLTVENRIAGQDNRFFGDSLITSIGRISLRKFKSHYYDHMFDYSTSKTPEGMTMARPFSHQGDFAANISKLSLGWCGDFEGDWDGLKLQISNIYTSAKAGYGALACEIGGFMESRSTKEQLIRYTQFGAMTACMVNGGENGAFTNHLPWYHDDETTEIYRYFTTLHYQLRPYMFSTLVDAHINGGSLLKDVSIEQESHKFGNDFFFKAITSDSGADSFILPEGDRWIDFWTDEIFEGGTQITKQYEISQAPLFIRSGAIIPLEITNDITGIGNESCEGKIILLIYPDKESQLLYYHPLGDGIEYEEIVISMNKGIITVESELEHSFVFLVKSINEPGGILEIRKSGKKLVLHTSRPDLG